MDRSKIIKRVIAKLESDIKKKFIEDLKDIYREHKEEDFKSTSLPKAVLQYVKNFIDNHDLDQPDKLDLLKEAKRNKFFDFTLNKYLEEVWRNILIEFNLSHYRLEGGL